VILPERVLLDFLSLSPLTGTLLLTTSSSSDSLSKALILSNVSQLTLASYAKYPD